jgi:hypothetical protein
MRQQLMITLFALLGAPLGAIGAAAEVSPDKAAPPKDVRPELVVRVSGGEPAKAIANAEVSLRGPDGGALDEPRRTDKKGQVRFRDLAKGEVTIVVIAKQWKTFKIVQTLGQATETADVVLESLD